MFSLVRASVAVNLLNVEYLLFMKLPFYILTDGSFIVCVCKNFALHFAITSFGFLFINSAGFIQSVCFCVCCLHVCQMNQVCFRSILVSSWFWIYSVSTSYEKFILVISQTQNFVEKLKITIINILTTKQNHTTKLLNNNFWFSLKKNFFYYYI